MTENLGNLRRTERGFEIITFHDRYNQACSLQQSSLAFEDAIWLGIAGNRMHLTESQVMNLVERLNVWLLSGDHSFKFHGESVEDLPAQVEDKKEEPVIFPEISLAAATSFGHLSASLEWLASEHEILEEKRQELQVSESYSYQRRQFVTAPLWRRLLIALFPAKHFK